MYYELGLRNSSRSGPLYTLHESVNDVYRGHLITIILITTSTRFVSKSEGVRNVFLTNFDYFFGGRSTKTWGVERHQRGD